MRNPYPPSCDKRVAGVYSTFYLMPSCERKLLSGVILLHQTKQTKMDIKTLAIQAFFRTFSFKTGSKFFMGRFEIFYRRPSINPKP